jgi:signal transduction histidine kinase
LIPRRFVRGRSVEGHGSGLGLAIVNRVAKDHGGELIVRSEEGRGTRMTLALPTVEEDADA